MKYYKQCCLAKATKNILEETKLWQHLEFQQIDLHSKPINGTTNAKINILRDELQNLADTKKEGRKIRSFNPMDAIWIQSK